MELIMALRGTDFFDKAFIIRGITQALRNRGVLDDLEIIWDMTDFEAAEMIIALYGTSYCGKAATIREVTEALGNQDVFLDNLEMLWHLTAFEAVLTTKGVRVGVVSEGYSHSNFEQRLRGMVERDVQVILTGCKTRGETVHIIEKVADIPAARVVWTSPYIHSHGDGDTITRLNSLNTEHLTELLISELEDAE
jgi:hypothetical protein